MVRSVLISAEFSKVFFNHVYLMPFLEILLSC